MGLEAVKEEVLGSAKEQESAMIAEAKKEAGRLMKDAESRIGALKEKSDAEAKKAIEIIKRQAVASAELEAKKMLLEAKKEMIEKVFAEARKKIDGMDEKKREAMLKKLLEKAKSELKVEYVYCSKKDAKFLKDSGTETAGITGGIIAENKETTIRIDYSFETLLESVKDFEMQNINKILFG